MVSKTGMFNVKHLNLYICLPPSPPKKQQQQQNPKNKQTGKIQSKQRQPALQRLLQVLPTKLYKTTYPNNHHTFDLPLTNVIEFIGK